MPGPVIPANNPAFPNSVFPNGVDNITNQMHGEIPDAISALQTALLPNPPAGSGLGSLNVVSLNVSGTVTAGAQVSAGGNVLGNQLIATGRLRPGDGTTASPNGIYGGTGAPSAALGADGDYYFRSGTPGTSLQRIYIRSAGAWVGIV